MDINENEKAELILELYKAGKKYKNIAKEVGVSIAWVGKIITRAKREGIIPNVQRKEREPRDKSVVKTIPNYHRKISELAKVWNEEPVNCDIDVSKTCVWGCCPTATESMNLCNYCFLVGHSRGCHFTECHRYIKITKQTPRPLVRFDSQIGVNYGITNYDR